MEQVTVRDLASEFEMKSSIVISELKKIGVWVPSPDTLVDSDIANRIRKRLQMIQEVEQAEKEKKAEKSRKSSTTKSKKSIRELGKPRKRTARKKPAEETEEAPPSLLGGSSLRPRKGRKSAYRKIETEEPSELVEEEKPQDEVSLEAPEISEEVQETLTAETAPVAPADEVVEETEEIPVKPEEEAVPAPEAPAETEAPEAVEAEPEADVPVPAETEEEIPAAEVSEVPTGIEPAVPEEVEKVAEPEAETELAQPVEEAVEEEKESVVTEEKPRKEEKAKPEEPVQPVRVKRAVARKKRKKESARKAKAKEKVEEAETAADEVVFSEKVTVKHFGEKTGIRSNEIIGALMQLGVMATMNQVLEQEILEKLCEKFDIVASFVSFEEEAAIEDVVVDKPENLVPRAPVVTVMGHVDHGKTTLLDFIRKTRVAESEEGGITQHIGASNVMVGDKKIVFIDTPGHEAFTRMRARGAQATDIVVLVVAADDGVMPQTLEAIDHAKAADVPIVVAVNKIDKAGANPQRVQQELSDRGLVPEDWGGDTVMVDVSAKEGTNVDNLLEMILLVGELQELKANPKRIAHGVVLEAKMEKGRGAVASLLVQNGTLSVGDTFIAGIASGRIRAMFSDQGKAVNKVGPSSAVEVLGLHGIPLAGDVFQVVDNQAKAREMVEFRLEKQRQEELVSKSTKVRSLEDLYDQIQTGEVKELPIIIKGDTQGSVEVLDDTLQKLGTDKVKIQVMRKGVGAISESDVVLATASNAIIIGFKVRPEVSARALAEQENVEIRLYGVIYDVENEIKQAMVGLLEPSIQEKYLGRAEVRETFRVPKVGIVAGCFVQDGVVSRNAELRLLRDNIVIHEGRFGSLKRFKDDVNEVRSGYECGISIAGFNDVKIGDVIEAFVQEEVAPQLN